MAEKLKTAAVEGAGMSAGAITSEHVGIKGHYGLECTDRTGAVLWQDEIENTVVTVGQNLMLSSALQGSAYTVTGPYMFLLSSVGFTAVAATDTMASHPGWNEADSTNAPAYSGNRPALTLGTAAGGAISTSALSFVFTGAGTVQGIGVVFGSGATVTPGSTLGTLLSAGTLATPQPVISGNTINATWTLTL